MIPFLQHTALSAKSVAIFLLVLLVVEHFLFLFYYQIASCLSSSTLGILQVAPLVLGEGACPEANIAQSKAKNPSGNLRSFHNPCVVVKSSLAGNEFCALFHLKCTLFHSSSCRTCSSSRGCSI